MTIRALKLDAFSEWRRIEARVMGWPAPPALPAPAVARRSGRAMLGALALAAAQAAALLLLPFVALVRVSVWLYLHLQWPAWLALAAGAGCTIAVVTAYAAWAWRRIAGRPRVRLIARRVATPLVVAYCAYALVYVSSAHAKSPRVAAYYTTLHPLLRVALSTVILADGDIVITDLARRPEDYRAMGLPANDGSLHYVQRDGYAHAADVRTIGRSTVQNWLVQLYFVTMGFVTWRHTGTADHLHVEVAVR